MHESMFIDSPGGLRVRDFVFPIWPLTEARGNLHRYQRLYGMNHGSWKARYELLKTTLASELLVVTAAALVLAPAVLGMK